MTQDTVPYNHNHPAETEPPEVSIAASTIPYPYDDLRARYLGYRACGLSVREALKILESPYGEEGIAKSTLSGWRKDSRFVELENKIPEIRQQLAKDYVQLEFFRNLRLVLEKDYRIIMKSLHPNKIKIPQVEGADKEVEEPLTAQEHDYLIKMRSQYSPQQLGILEAVIGKPGGSFDFAKMVADNKEFFQFSRTDTVTVRK
jgi:hypothetical protein